MSGTGDAGPHVKAGIEASERSRSPLDEIVEPAAGRTLEVVVDDDGPLFGSLGSTARRPWVAADERRRGSSGRPRSCSRRAWTDSGPDLGRRLRSGSVPLANGPGHPAQARWPLTYAANSRSNSGHHAGSASGGGHGGVGPPRPQPPPPGPLSSESSAPPSDRRTACHRNSTQIATMASSSRIDAYPGEWADPAGCSATSSPRNATAAIVIGLGSRGAPVSASVAPTDDAAGFALGGLPRLCARAP